MNIKSWLEKSSQTLGASGVTTAQLDAEILLADILDKDRSWMHAHPDSPIHAKTLETIDKQVERRAAHEPLAYIRGKQEFYGQDFIVSADTLTPRPETETMVELLVELVKKQKVKSKKLQLIDVGTGNGCIIITVALELAKISNLKSKISYTGLDVSAAAIRIAERNSIILNQKVNFQHYDLLWDDLSSVLNSHPSNLILANLPYVPESHPINKSAAHEPKLAIFGGKDGLDYYRALFSKLNLKVNYILTESLTLQHDKLTDIASSHGFLLKQSSGLIQVFKRATT